METIVFQNLTLETTIRLYYIRYKHLEHILRSKKQQFGKIHTNIKLITQLESPYLKIYSTTQNQSITYNSFEVISKNGYFWEQKWQF